MIVRPEASADVAAIHAVNQAAFAQPDEADLVDRLRAEGVVLLSLVAEHNAVILGHILFTRMHVAETPVVALAPVAVDPAHQRKGIGAALICRGIDLLREAGERIVIVVGHPAYYPRFGFTGVSGIQHPFPPESFMALELTTGALENLTGAVRYPPGFGL